MFKNDKTSFLIPLKSQKQSFWLICENRWNKDRIQWKGEQRVRDKEGSGIRASDSTQEPDEYFIAAPWYQLQQLID